jgi:hypothetical protein
MELDEKIKNEIDHVATVIVKNLRERCSLLINIQVEPEYSQYDVLFTYRYNNLGSHQRGISAIDLIIGVIGFGCYGFRVDIADTDPGYYSEKLGIHSNFLSFLFNEVRKKLKELK